MSVATPKLVEPATKPRPGDTAIIQRLDLPSTEFIGDVKTEAAKPVSAEPELVKPARPRPTARPKPVPPAAPAVAVPPAPATPAAPVPTGPGAPAARITLPPKPPQPKPTQPGPAQNDVAPLIPTPPAATSVTPAVDPVSAPVAPEPGRDHAPSGLARDVEETRIVASRLGDRFVLQFSTGENSTVYGTGLVGRNPVTQPGEYVDQLVTILDPGKSVSKTHLEFGQTAGAFWVVDRYSANGTIVRQPDAPPQRLDPGKRQPVARGTRVDMGEQFFVVS